MHETAIAYEIMKQVAQTCRDAGASHATRIEIEVGENSGIDSKLLRETLLTAYTRLSSKPDTEIDLTEIPVRAHCPDCNTDFTPSSLFAPCPVCNKYRYEITQGDELRLRAVWIEQPNFSE